MCRQNVKFEHSLIHNTWKAIFIFFLHEESYLSITQNDSFQNTHIAADDLPTYTGRSQTINLLAYLYGKINAWPPQMLPLYFDSLNEFPYVKVFTAVVI